MYSQFPIPKQKLQDKHTYTNHKTRNKEMRGTEIKFSTKQDLDNKCMLAI